MGRYVKRMTYGDYATATGGRLSEEVLGWDVWVVTLAATLKYRGLLSEHMRDHQRTFNYVAIVLEAVGGEIISTAFYAESGEQRPFPVG